MVLPRMDPDPLTRPREAQPITTATCVHEARAWLATTGERAAVVYRSGRPVGVVTAAALAHAVENRPADTPVTSVMDYVAVQVRRNADARSTVRAFNDAASAWRRGHRAPVGVE